MKNVIMIGAMASLLAACSSNKVAVMDSPPPHSGVDKEVYNYKTKLANEQVKKIRMVHQIPEDEESIYAVGTVSPDLQLSNDIAILLAKRTLVTVSMVSCVLKQSRSCQRLHRCKQFSLE